MSTSQQNQIQNISNLIECPDFFGIPVMSWMGGKVPKARMTKWPPPRRWCPEVGDYDKRVISKTTLPTTPELFRGLIQAIWRKNYQIWLKKTPWTLQKTKSGYLGPPPITQVAQNKCSSLNLGYFDACKFFIYCLRIFAIFSKTLWHPGTPGGARGVPGGPPQGGYPIWVPLSNNFDILRFWNILE